MGDRARTVMCIDLKSFYASVECVDRGLDPFSANLVVADPTRSGNTICLAASPAIKAHGVKSRCRLRQIPADLDFVVAVPRMKRYMQVSASVVDTYLGFVAPEDMHVYSIDESFVDATPYLRLYGCTARELARRMTGAVLREHGITATAGIGSNMFLAKVALDLLAKHAPDGIAELDQRSFRRDAWFHRPITDVWGIGPGIARRLARHGAFDLAGVCAMRPETLRREFGKNAELLIDHAWGLEPCTVAEARSYRPRAHSIANGQVLMRDYSAFEARTLVKEMVHESVLELVDKGLLCSSVGVWASRSQRVGKGRPLGPRRSDVEGAALYGDGGASSRGQRERFVATVHGASGGTLVGTRARVAARQEPYGMPSPDKVRPAGHGHAPGVGASCRLAHPTDDEREIALRALELFDRKLGSNDAVRRVGVSLEGLVPAGAAQTSLFDDEVSSVRQDALQKAEAAVRDKFGANALLRGTSLRPEANACVRNEQVGGHRA